MKDGQLHLTNWVKLLLLINRVCKIFNRAALKFANLQLFQFWNSLQSSPHHLIYNNTYKNFGRFKYLVELFLKKKMNGFGCIRRFFAQNYWKVKVEVFLVIISREMWKLWKLWLHFTKCEILDNFDFSEKSGNMSLY